MPVMKAPRTRSLPLAVLFAGLLVPGLARAQNGGSQVVPRDELRSVAPNVYLDCERRFCDFDYIKTEITFVNYVLDRQSADIHIIVTRQQTGGGGNEYTLAFMGLKRHQAIEVIAAFGGVVAPPQPGFDMLPAGPAPSPYRIIQWNEFPPLDVDGEY